ncbi:MAG: hypothetical protein CW341_09165 [Bacteroidetes bacterium]|nr:hypothetical protein [Bacteroidota bacterium]
MENKLSDTLSNEQQTIPLEENAQQEDQTEHVVTEKSTDFRTIFEKFSGASLGIGSSICAIISIFAIGWGVVTLCEIGYEHWFDDLYGREIGQNGLLYVASQDAIMKTRPNRKVLTHVTRLDKIDDSTGIVCYNGKEGLLDFNTVKFVLPAKYDKIWSPAKNTYMAVKQDTVYTIIEPGGEIVKCEPTAGYYRDIRPIYRDNDMYYYEDRCEADILLYEYKDYTGRCGMMSKDLQKLTPAIYHYIEPVIGKEDTFLCHYEGDEEEGDESLEGAGELRNSKGEKIE